MSDDIITSSISCGLLMCIVVFTIEYVVDILPEICRTSPHKTKAGGHCDWLWWLHPHRLCCGSCCEHKVGIL
jgi:hypothetical protein